MAAAAVTGGMVLPASASASSLGGWTPPIALFGVDIGELVQGIIEKIVSLVLPSDLAGQWAVGLVKWLVVVPDVADAARFPHVNAFRSGLVGIGFALLAVSITLCGVQVALGAPILADAVKRTVIAAGVLVIYPKLVSTVIRAVNIITGDLLTNHLIAEGTDKMLGAALVVGVVTGGFGWSLVLGAALFCLYFIAALMVIKIGLTAVLAVLLLSGALVWGLYPLPATAWIARAWLSAAFTVALIPIGWALVFSAGALLSSDSLVWAGSGGGLGDQLENIAKPFSALGCFWVAYRTPTYMLGAARFLGISPRASIAGRSSGSGSSPTRPAASAVRTNTDRFRAVSQRIGARAAPVASRLKSRAVALGDATRQASLAKVAPTAVTASLAAGAPDTKTGRIVDRVGPGLAHAGAEVGRGLKAIASAPVKANRGWRQLAAEGAELRKSSRPGPSPSSSTDNAVTASPARQPDAVTPAATRAVSGSAPNSDASTPVPASTPPAPADSAQPHPPAVSPDRAPNRTPADHPSSVSGSPPPPRVAPDSPPPLPAERPPTPTAQPPRPTPARPAPSSQAAPSAPTRQSGEQRPAPVRAPAPEIRRASPPKRKPS
jgi:hypothetical protein